MTVFRPADAAEAAEVVARAAAEAAPLAIVAGGSKRRLGRPVVTEHTLDVSGLAGVVDYAPAELVLTARPSTPMAEIAPMLAAERQMLAFEPPDWRALLGGGGEPTLGGLIACNVAGSRRVRAGAARDHFLGFSAINGWGDVWKAGGRVVKNVTGYDMCKLQCGAFGTLSVLTELSVRVVPRPETSCTVLVSGLDDAAAMVMLAAALNTPHEVSAAAHLPASVAARAAVVAGGGAVTALRLEGPAPSVAYRAEALAALGGTQSRLDAAATEPLWTAVGDVTALLPAGIVWRVCPTPSRAAEVVAAIRDRLGSAVAFYDWGGGLVWLRLDPDDAGADAGAAVVRTAVRAAGGHATLFVAPDDVRAAVPVFEPEPEPVVALSRRIKAGFDPRGVLNPGRMFKGR